MKPVFILFVFLAFVPGTTALLYEKGETILTALKIPLSARAQAMGGAGVACVNDGASATLNPAGLCNIGQDQIFLEHINYLQNMRTEFLSAVLLYPKVKIGVALQYFDLGEGPVVGEDGSDYSVDNTFHAFDMALMLTGQFKVKGVEAGLTLKVLREDIWYYSSSGLALDMGVIHRGLVKNLTLGASLLNLGWTGAFDVKRYPLTSILRAGAAYEYPLSDRLTLTGAADLNVSNDKSVTLPLGMEAAWEFFSLRAGVHLFHDTRSFSLGGGVSIGSFTLDYSYIHFTEDLNVNGRPHFFALTLLI